jgi:hypothetical protein
MPSWDDDKTRDGAPTHAGAFASELIDAQDTDPVSIDAGPFDEDEVTRADLSPRAHSENLPTVQGLPALEEESEPAADDE